MRCTFGKAVSSVVIIAVQSSWNQKLHCNDILYVTVLLDPFMTNRIIRPSLQHDDSS